MVLEIVSGMVQKLFLKWLGIVSEMVLEIVSELV
jgi:hypothetical protein